MNFKRGISLVALLITILVLMILSSIVVLSAKNSTDSANLVDFMSDLEKIEDATKNYFIGEGSYPYLDFNKLTQAEVLELVGESKRASLREEMESNGDYKEDGDAYYYSIDLSKLGVTQTKRGIKKDGDITDIYVVSTLTNRVYYLKGLETKDNIYFSLSQKAVKLYSVNESIAPAEEEIDSTFKVSFDYNFETGDIVTGNDVDYKNIKYGSKYDVLPIPTRTSKVYEVSYDPNGGVLGTLENKNTKNSVKYEFFGWYKEPLLINKVTNESVLNTASDHDLYAKWVVSEPAVIELPNVTRENYVFDSWYDSDGNNVGGIGDKYELAFQDVDLVAHWKALGFTLVVNPSKEEFSESVGTVKSITAPISEYEIIYEAQGGTVEKTVEKANRSFVSWELSGGGSINSSSANPVQYTFENANATLTAKYETYSDAVILPEVSKEGYTFDGWYTDKEAGQKVGNAGDSYITDKNIKLYAQYTKNASYKVEYYLENINDDNYTLESTTTYEGPIGRDVNAQELSFDGFYIDKNVVGTVSSGAVLSDGSLVLKLYYRRNTYTLAFTIVGGDGKVYTSGSYKHGKEVEIVANPNEGSSFENWSTTSNIDIVDPLSATTTFIMPKENVNITANFKYGSISITDVKSPNYNIDYENGTFSTSGGEFTFEVPGEGYTFDIDTTGANVFVKNEGETEKTAVFSGVSNDVIYKTTGKCELTFSGVGSMVIYFPDGSNAQIVDNIPTYTVTLYSPTSDDLYETITVKKLTALQEVVSDPTREGYDFVGWSVNADATTGTYPYISQDSTYYAIWNAKTLYLEPNIPSYSVTSNILSTNYGTKTYLRMRADENTYSVTGTLDTETSLLKSYSYTDWLIDNATSTLQDGSSDTNIDLTLSIPKNMMFGIINSSSNVQFKIGEDLVPIMHILDGYVSDGKVSHYDGRYTSSGPVYSTDSESWTDMCKQGYATVISDFVRGENYFEFNGDSSWVNAGQIDNPNLTIQTVFSSSKTSREEYEFIAGNAENGGFGLYIDTDNKIKGKAYIEGEFRYVEATDTYAANTIIEAAMTYNGSILCLYINGTLVDTLSISGEITAPENDTVIAIGTDPNGTSGTNNTYFEGNIYSMILYDKALASVNINKNHEINQIHIYGL